MLVQSCKPVVLLLHFLFLLGTYWDTSTDHPCAQMRTGTAFVAQLFLEARTEWQSRGSLYTHTEPLYACTEANNNLVLSLHFFVTHQKHIPHPFWRTFHLFINEHSFTHTPISEREILFLQHSSMWNWMVAPVLCSSLFKAAKDTTSLPLFASSREDSHVFQLLVWFLDLGHCWNCLNIILNLYFLAVLIIYISFLSFILKGFQEI